MSDGSAIHNGTLYQDVNFVDSPNKAKLEILYDKIEYNKENDCWLYFYRGYLVAIKINEQT